MTLVDKPGSLAKIATCLGDAGVSIDQMRQYGHQGANAPVLIVTHKAAPDDVAHAMTRFAAIRASIVAAAALVLSACGINSVPAAEENAKAKWADVQSAYQRRADLVDNLVRTVRGYADHEREVLTQVTEARASASLA